MGVVAFAPLYEVEFSPMMAFVIVTAVEDEPCCWSSTLLVPLVMFKRGDGTGGCCSLPLLFPKLSFHFDVFFTIVCEGTGVTEATGVVTAVDEVEGTVRRPDVEGETASSAKTGEVGEACGCEWGKARTVDPFALC